MAEQKKIVYKAPGGSQPDGSSPGKKGFPVWILLIVVLLAAAAAFFFKMKGDGASSAPEPTPTPAPTATATPTETPTPTPEPEPEIFTLTFSATGDDLIHDGVYKQAAHRAGSYTYENTDAYDFLYCYQNVKSFYEAHDLNWINQETLITDTLDPSTYPAFSSPGKLGRDLYDVGFRAFSISNNHSYDKGTKGISATLEYWASLADDITVSGLYSDVSEQNDYGVVFREQNGITFAFVSYTEMTNGIPTPSGAEAHVIYTSETDLIRQQVTYAAEKADFVIVSCHWGVEDSHTIVDSQRALAQQLSDWGADLIIGTHPHVLQDAEWLKGEQGNDTFVAYSLGNFLSAQSRPDEMIGLLLDCTFTKQVDPDGTVTTTLSDPKLHPVINHYDAGWSDIRLYLLSDYTEQLANNHGVRANYPHFGMEYIQKVISDNLNEEFLAS